MFTLLSMLTGDCLDYFHLDPMMIGILSEGYFLGDKLAFMIVALKVPVHASRGRSRHGTRFIGSANLFPVAPTIDDGEDEDGGTVLDSAVDALSWEGRHLWQRWELAVTAQR